MEISVSEVAESTLLESGHENAADPNNYSDLASKRSSLLGLGVGAPLEEECSLILELCNSSRAAFRVHCTVAHTDDACHSHSHNSSTVTATGTVTPRDGSRGALRDESRDASRGESRGRSDGHCPSAGSATFVMTVEKLCNKRCVRVRARACVSSLTARPQS